MGGNTSIPEHPEGATMNAIAFSKYGGKLKKKSIPKPHGFGDEEVLIKVHAASINPVDKLFIQGDLKLVKDVASFPHVVCYDAAGTVEVADKAGTFVVGDAVFTRLFGPAPGVEAKTPWYRGSLAEYCVARAENCAKKPANITFEQAASIPLAGMTALQAMRSIQGKEGQKVFISGGAGGVGTLAIQLAKRVFRAASVVTTASEGAKTELCRELGADQVVDYRTDKFEETLAGADFDLCLDFTNESLKMARIVKKGGQIVSISGQPTIEAIRGIGGTHFVLGLVLSSREKRAEFKAAQAAGADWKYIFLHADGADLQTLADALQDGRLKAVVDNVWQFSDDDTESASGWNGAFSRQFGGRAMGKCVVKII